jgi:hypothetical protein
MVIIDINGNKIPMTEGDMDMDESLDRKGSHFSTKTQLKLIGREMEIDVGVDMMTARYRKE